MRAGFTLLEVLVTLVVLGLLIVGLAAGTRFGLRANDRQASAIEQRSALDAVDRALRTLLSQADPGTADVASGFKGEAARVAFRSVLQAGPADIALGIDGQHRLVLRWSPYRHVQLFQPPPPPRTEVLLDGISRLQLSYWGHAWQPSWDEPTLPLLVRISIGFAEGDKRHWPDLVIRLARQAPP